MKKNRPSPILIVFLLFPLAGLVAAGVMILTNTSPETGGRPPTPAPVTLAPPPVSEDTPIIDFTLTSLDGETVSLTDYSGRIVFLNFWATWCIPCRKELPAFMEFQAAQTADGPAILAVNVQDSAEAITQFLDEYGVSGLNILLDSDSAVSERYGIFNMPTTSMAGGSSTSSSMGK
jgi:peroxiredoxin